MAWTREQFKELYWQRKAALIERLGGKCVKCGSTSDLQFHHKDPGNKVSAVLKSLNSRRSIDEAKKCELLCEQCHRDYHATPRKHGTMHSYSRHKCRCDLCRAAASKIGKEYKRLWRLKKGMKPRIRAMPE